MKSQQIISFGLISIILTILFYQVYLVNSKLDTFLEGTKKNVLVLPDGFDYVKKRFDVFNSEVDTMAVVKFVTVTKHFSLHNDKLFDMVIGQIILESNAAQFYGAGHPKRGLVVRGTSGEVGIAQILPQTALFYLRDKVKDAEEIKLLGGTDFLFVHNDKLSDSEKNSLVINWLSSVDNNLILWGFIMRDNLKNNGVLAALVIYNAGKGGLSKHLSSEQPITDHKYITGLYSRLRTLKSNGITSDKRYASVL